MVFANTQNQPRKTKRAIFLPTLSNDDEMNEKIANIELKELSDIENLSVRTVNICKYNGLLDLNKILQSFWENGDFKKLRNCGSNSNKELIDICNKYENSIIRPPEPITENQKEKNIFIETIDNLTIKQKAVLNNIIFAKFRNLTARSNNALGNYLENSITIKNLNKYIFSDSNFTISTLKNIGNKAGNEIDLFLNETKELIKLVSVFESENELNRELFNALLIKLFSANLNAINKIGNNYDFSEGIPIFKTIHILIEENHIFNKKEKIIFKHSLGFFNDTKVENLDETGNRLKLTRERTRQIRNKILDNFNRYFSFISFFEKESLNIYSLDTSTLLLNIDQVYLDELSKTELVNYNKFFVNRIFSILLKDKYSLVGNEDKVVLGKASRNYHNWNSTYLISKQIHSMFDFERMINDVNSRLSDKVTEDYKFHFQTYLLDFKKSNCYEYLDEISQISEQILFNEFEIIIDSEENIIFKRNIHKSITDYIYDTLEEANTPLNVYEIFDVLNQQYPGISKSAEALRGSCQRDSRLIYFGRSSTYGLKSWEKNLDNIKGGTMHDISEEFLLKFNTPKHIDEIAEYVGNYRNNVTSKNLLYNLKSAEHKRFTFFQNRLIGLVSKTYNISLFPAVPKYYKDKKSWEENYGLLKDFSTKNECLPTSSGTDEEKKLYRFFNIQIRKIDELDNTKKELIEALMIRYNYQKRKRHGKNIKWDNSYNELKAFITAQGRFPSMQISNEQKLYGFFYRQKKISQDNKLSEVYLNKFLEIIELMKKVKI